MNDPTKNRTWASSKSAMRSATILWDLVVCCGVEYISFIFYFADFSSEVNIEEGDNDVDDFAGAERAS